MQQTKFLLPTQIIANGEITGTQWTDTNNLLLLDGEVAQSSPGAGVSSDVTVGGFNANIPDGSAISGVEITIVGYRGEQIIPVITISPNYIDNTSGSNIIHPYVTPFSGLTPASASYVLGTSTYLFGTTINANQANNFKLNLISNGDVFIDTVLVSFFYTTAATETLNYNSLVGTFLPGDIITGALSGTTATIVSVNVGSEITVTAINGVFLPGENITGSPSGATATLNTTIAGICIDCESPIQVQAMALYLPFLIGETKFYLKPGSFSYPDGTPVQPGDVGSCGGKIPFVFDEGKRKTAGSNFEENAVLDTNVGGWTVLSSGVIEMNLGNVNKRGLEFKKPAGHVSALMSDHDANSKVIISNNEPYNLTLVRACQADFIFSPPITVQDEGINKTTSLHLLNFVGEGVVATLSALHNILVTITDRFSRITASDTTSGYLNSKIVAGTNVTIAVLNPGANEQLQISATGGTGGGHVIQDNGVSLPAEPALNFVDFFTLANVPGTSTDVNVNVVELANDNTFNTTLANNSNFVNALTSNSTFQSAVNTFVSGSGAIQIDQTPDSGSYGLLAGAVNGVNTAFTVSLGTYGSGKLQVYLNGLIQLQGASNDWQETTPGSGTFNFITAPATNDIITVVYNGAGSGGGSAETVSLDVNQVAHGFSIGNVVRSSGINGQYTKSKSDISANSEVTGIVSSVADANNFTIVTEGFVNISSLPGGSVAGNILFLSDTVAGGLTLIEPTTGTTVSKPVAEVIDAAASMIYWHNYRGQVNQTVPLSFGTKVYLQTSTFSSPVDTNENIVSSFSVPANRLSTNNALRVSIKNIQLTTSGGTYTSTFRLKYGGTTISTLVMNAGNIVTATGEIDCILAGAGSFNSQAADSNILFVTQDAARRTTRDQTTSTSSVDSTLSQFFTITVQNSVAQPANIGFILAELIS